MGKPARAGDVYACKKHSYGMVYFHAYDSDDCPACEDVARLSNKIKELRQDLRASQKDNKLLRYELKEARDKLKVLKVETATYLTTKKEVADLVNERL